MTLYYLYRVEVRARNSGGVSPAASVMVTTQSISKQCTGILKALSLFLSWSAHQIWFLYCYSLCKPYLVYWAQWRSRFKLPPPPPPTHPHTFSWASEDLGNSWFCCQWNQCHNSVGISWRHSWCLHSWIFPKWIQLPKCGGVDCKWYWDIHHNPIGWTRSILHLSAESSCGEWEWTVGIQSSNFLQNPNGHYSIHYS